MTTTRMATMVLSAFASAAGAQTALRPTDSGRTSVEQISPNARPMVDQLDSDRTSPNLRQLAPAGAVQARTNQISARDTNPRLSVIPASMIDACDEAARGRRPAPEGVDCASVLQVIAQQPRRQSAEEALLIGTAGNGAVGGVAPQPLVTPNADRVAQRLGNGDIDDAPFAQAVASAFQGSTGVQPGGTAAATTPVIVPGGSSAPVLPTEVTPR